eukprot:1160575-Pelagomonas_calceolata.AAC.5
MAKKCADFWASVKVGVAILCLMMYTRFTALIIRGHLSFLSCAELRIDVTAFELNSDLHGSYSPIKPF